jgi:Flp pilus assembly protein TadD
MKGGDIMSASSIIPNGIHENLGEDLGVEKLRERLAENPCDGRIWHQLGSLLRNLGRCDEAEEALRNAITYKPNSIWSWTQLALLYEETDRIHDANKAWNAVDALRAEIYSLGFSEVPW